MSLTSITLSLQGFRQLPADAQSAILKLMATDWEIPGMQADEVASDIDTTLAVLASHQAKEFLNKCNEKTRGILGLIVEAKGSFLLSSVSAFTKNTPSELRGAWAGLTKRTRTITQNNEAKLISWTKSGDDWHGTMDHRTTASMAVALEHRASSSGI